MAHGPRQGDLVWYAGCSLYFQPNGTSCYLYAHESDVGRTERAVFMPARTSVIFPAPAPGLMPRHPLAALPAAPALVLQEVEELTTMLRQMDSC